jgi:CheY-like chemotaxis protein
MKNHVLMIDDDRQVMSVYETALRKRQFEVTRFSGEACVDDALRFLGESANQVDVIVADIMMPPGETLRDRDTDEGMRTGVVLLEMLKTSHPSLPLLVLTNVQQEDILGQIRRVVPHAKVLHKPYCPPFELAEEIAGCLRPKAPQAKKES